jgi:hypothetical protein
MCSTVFGKALVAGNLVFLPYSLVPVLVGTRGTPPYITEIKITQNEETTTTLPTTNRN